MRIWGISDSSHDASLAVMENGEIALAGHAERYSKQKQDFAIHPDLWAEALEFGPPDLICYFERRNLKRLRRLVAGGLNGAYQHLYRRRFRAEIPEVQVSHHRSHASGGFFTSGMEEAVVVVIDAIGEIETASIWDAQGCRLTKLHSLHYPTSFGLFYSAFTDRLGLQAGQDEYVLMGMAAYGDPDRYKTRVEALFPAWNYQPFNLHAGLPPFPIDDDRLAPFDLAASVQEVYEQRLTEYMALARRLTGSTNLVFMGGCALNCVANERLRSMFDRIWIMPNPGDAGSSLGAILARTRSHIPWSGPYLGTNIPGDYPVQPIIDKLQTHQIVAVASGRAEFGPRALGNRSILADPRSEAIRDQVNLIKERQPFRPFAPVVTEEAGPLLFDLSGPSPYMSFAVRCRRPDLIPAVVHADGTSRVQTVSKEQHPGLHEVLTKWGQITGIPVLLNTSLNIKGQPILNDEQDITEWEKMYRTEIVRSL